MTWKGCHVGGRGPVSLLEQNLSVLLNKAQLWRWWVGVKDNQMRAGLEVGWCGTDRCRRAFLFVCFVRKNKEEFMRSNMPWKSLCVTGAPSFSLKLSQFLGESVVLGVKNNHSGLFPVPTKGFCQQSGIASSSGASGQGWPLTIVAGLKVQKVVS